MHLMEALNFINELIFKNKKTQGGEITPKGLPVWLEKAAQFYEIRVGEGQRILLIKPLKEFEFGQYANILQQVEKRLEGVAILIADDLNPKYRSLFVKNNVSFIYKNQSVFAPKLGLMLFDYKAPKALKNRILEEEISPFEMKLLAGYLTGHIVREGFNLSDLEMILKSKEYKCSKAKLSQAINHIIELGLMDVQGSGPNRIVKFKSRNEIWEEIKDYKVKPFFKMVEGYYLIDDLNYIFSGETALAYYTNLAESAVKHIALTRKEFESLEEHGRPVGDFGQPLYIFEIFKESPKLFAMDDGYLNPIELYFMYRGDKDERIQIELEKMIKNIGFKL
jgi:hypothetical protein